MNKIPRLLFIFLVLIGLPSCFNAHSESAEHYDILTDITDAFKKSDYRKLMSQSSELIELTFENDVRHYSKVQAKFALKDFFKNYPVQKFEVVHRSESKPFTQYVIGEYKSHSDEYRISIRMHQSQGKYEIDMIKFRRNS